MATLFPQSLQVIRSAMSLVLASGPNLEMRSSISILIPRMGEQFVQVP